MSTRQLARRDNCICSQTAERPAVLLFARPPIAAPKARLLVRSIICVRRGWRRCNRERGSLFCMSRPRMSTRQPARSDTRISSQTAERHMRCVQSCRMLIMHIRMGSAFPGRTVWQLSGVMGQLIFVCHEFGRSSHGFDCDSILPRCHAVFLLEFPVEDIGRMKTDRP